MADDKKAAEAKTDDDKTVGGGSATAGTAPEAPAEGEKPASAKQEAKDSKEAAKAGVVADPVGQNQNIEGKPAGSRVAIARIQGTPTDGTA